MNFIIITKKTLSGCTLLNTRVNKHEIILVNGSIYNKNS